MLEPDLELVGGLARRDRTVVVWRDADERKQTRPVADAGDVRFEDALAARSFPQYKDQRYFPGWKFFHTTGTLVGFESRLERDNLTLLDFDPDIVRVSSQPCWFAGGDEDGYWWRCPDFFARRSDGTGLFVDVKPEYLLDDPYVGRGFERAAEACEAGGWDYLVVSEPDPVYGPNVDWLCAYARDLWDPFGLSDRVLRAAERPTRIDHLLDAVGDHALARPFVFHHLWHRRLFADLHTEFLEPHTTVSPYPLETNP